MCFYHILTLTVFLMGLSLKKGTEAQLTTTTQSPRIQRLAEAKKNLYSFYQDFLDQPCDFSLYNATMPEYWDAVFGGLDKENKLREVRLKYWNVFVEFEDDEQEKRVQGYVTGTKTVTQFTVKRSEQKAFEKSICSSPGGFLECSVDGRCACLGSTNPNATTITIRVNSETRMANATGDACFVTVGAKCVAHFFDGKVRVSVKLPCVGLDRCVTEIDGHTCESSGQATDPYSYLQALGICISLVVWKIGAF